MRSESTRVRAGGISIRATIHRHHQQFFFPNASPEPGLLEGRIG
ncbi:hypothetical protein [Floridanema evergladense]|uniref:Uncharacterized protein n=1 Tax=Floridaenema evergladense BLCC-F167 TaxID=3153639 RepID=A0ABV4WTS8_9CYAN